MVAGSEYREIAMSEEWSFEKDDFLTLTSGKGRQMHIYLTPKGRQFCEKKNLSSHSYGK